MATLPTSPAEEPRRLVLAGDPTALSLLRRVVARAARHRAFVLFGGELVILAVTLSLVASRIPALVSSTGTYLDQLRHPSPFGLAVAMTAEAVSLFAFAMIPRFLLGAHDVRLRRRDAVAVGLAANGLAVVLPGGSVPSSVWLAHQLTRRGARSALAAWTVLASGFASTVTLLLILLVGAGVASVISPLVVAVLALAVLAGALGFLSLVHQVDALAVWSKRRNGGGAVGRLVARFVTLASEAAQWRAGWRTGAAVLFSGAVNWLADAGCLVGVFFMVDASVPWRSVLVAYAAGQILGAVVPLPGGLGAVEGGLVGTLVALGSPAGPVILVVAVYRLLGYWLPAAAALPAYGWARREPATAGMSNGGLVKDAGVVRRTGIGRPGEAGDVAAGVVPWIPGNKHLGAQHRAAQVFCQAMAGPIPPPAYGPGSGATVIDLEMIGASEGEPVMCRGR